MVKAMCEQRSREMQCRDELPCRRKYVIKTNYKRNVPEKKKEICAIFFYFFLYKFWHLALLCILLDCSTYSFLNAGWISASSFVNLKLILDVLQIVRINKIQETKKYIFDV